MLKGFKATEKPDEYIRVGKDENGNETHRVRFNIYKHPGYAKELNDFKKNNGAVEEAETEAEKAIREDKEKKQALLKQEQDILGYFQKYDYHFRTKRKKFLPDVETIWEPVFDKWDDQLDLVREQIKLMNEGKSFVLINIDPIPVFT